MSRDHKPAPLPLFQEDDKAGARAQVFTDTMGADNARTPLSALHHGYALPEP